MLDLREVDFIDCEGQQLLAEMHTTGVRLVAVTPLIQALCEEISGTSGCGTVEEKLAGRPDAIFYPHTPGHDPRAV